MEDDTAANTIPLEESIPSTNESEQQLLKLTPNNPQDITHGVQNPNIWALSIVYMTVFIDLLGFTIVLPLLPYIALQMGGSGLLIGIMVTSYAAASFFSSLVLGRISDRFGRRNILLISLLGSSLSLIAFGLSSYMWQLILARCFGGLFGGSIPVAQAYVADSTSLQDRAKYVGRLGAAVGLGIVLGPAIGGLLSNFGFSTACFVAAGIAGLNLLIAIFILKESRRPESGQKLLGLWQTLRMFEKRQFFILFSVGFIMNFAFSGIEMSLSLIGYQHYEFTPQTLGYMFTMFGLVMAITQVALVGFLKKKIGLKRMALIGSFFEASVILASIFTPSTIYLLLVVAAVALFHGILQPTMPTNVSLNAHPGFALGIYSSFAAMGRIFSPLVFGTLYDAFYQLPFIVGSGSFLLIFSMIIFLPPPDSSLTFMPISSEEQQDTALDIETV